MKIKWCISDIDGTLTNSARRIEREVVDAIREYEARGGVFVLATGRTMLTARDVAEQIGISSPIIAGNGSVIGYMGGETLLCKKIGDAASKISTEYALENGIDFVAFSQHAVWHPHYSVRVRYYKEKMTHVPLFEFSKADELPHGEIIKFFLWNMEEELIQNFKLNCNSDEAMNCVQSVRGTLDVDPAGATKGNGVRFLAERLGLSTDDAAAFGDNMNDRDLLESVGYPVAVGNAEEELKRVARRIAPSNDELGVAVMLREFMGYNVRNC